MKKLENRKDLEQLIINERNPILLYFYTPLCGTCQLASSFLTVLEKVDNVPPIYELDINYFKEDASKWEIISVPCLVFLSNTELRGKLYAFESVTNVYDFITNNNNKI